MDRKPFLPDVLVLIFEELHVTGSLRSLRLVSTQFEDLIVPILYRRVVLTGQLIAQYRKKKVLHDYTTLQQKMGRCTSDVVIRHQLDWTSVMNMLDTLENIESLTWKYQACRGNPDNDSIFNNGLAFEDIRLKWPELKYSVEGLNDVLAAAWSTTNSNFRTVAPARLVSCNFVRWHSLSYENYGKSLLLHNRQLETLHISGSDHYPTIPQAEIKHKDRMPQLQELVLHRFEWPYSAHMAVNFWDWSHLARLELKMVCIVLFLQTVTPEHLTQLQEFTTDGYCSNQSERIEATDLITTLVSSIRALKKLILTCNVGDEKCVSAVLKHGSTLRTLQLRIYQATQSQKLSDRLNQQPVNERQLESIRKACPRLTTLILDYDARGCTKGVQDGLDASGKDNVLATFRNLRRLTAYAWTCYHDDSGPAEERSGRDSRWWVRKLVAAKHGTHFESILLKTDVFSWSIKTKGFYWGTQTHSHNA